MTYDLFNPPVPLHDERRTLEGEIRLDAGPAGVRRYRWKLHLERISPDWIETRDSITDHPQPPGWAFGMLYLDPSGEWRPVRNHNRTWAGWGVVRDLPEVRESLGRQLLESTATPTQQEP